jgi:hypothetical protein
MATEPDRRYELKITIERYQLAQARMWVRLNPAGFRTTYAPRFVNSVYFDTPDLTNLKENLAGVSLRQKIRLRWYGDLSTRMEKPVLELKFKKNMLGGKKRLELPGTIELTDRWTEIMSTIRTGVPAAWGAYLATNVQPTLLVHYRREYFATVDGRVRATLDYDQRAFGQRLGARPNLARRLPIGDLLVIELKAGYQDEERLEEIVAHLPLARSRNSKYVTGVLAEG